MKYFIALFALVAVASANPLPLVQIIVNIDATESAIGVSPVAVEGVGESPAVAEMPILDFTPEEPGYNPLPLPVPQPIPEIPDVVVLPEPAEPEVVPSPDPIVLPEPVMPEVVPSPEPIEIPEAEGPASIPITPVVVPTPIEI